MTTRGGARPGAGRKSGSRNKETVAREIRAAHGVQAALETGVMPLDVLLTVMRGGPEADAITDRQFQAARDAAPYLHHRLQAATLKGDPAAPLEVRHSAAEVDARINELLARARGEAPSNSTKG